MYFDSTQQVFARVARVRAEAARMMSTEPLPELPPLDDHDDEAEALAAGVDLRLPKLRTLFELPPLAMDVVICLLAAEYEPLLRLYERAVQRDGTPWLELGTLADLLRLDAPRLPQLAALFAPTGALRRNALVSVEESGPELPVTRWRAKLEARVCQFLLGDDELPPWLRLVDPVVALADSWVAPETANAVAARLRRSILRGEPLLIELRGALGSGRRFLAEGLAGALGRGLLIADVSEHDLERALHEAEREALLSGALLCLVGVEEHLRRPAVSRDEEAPPRDAPRRLPPPLERWLARLRMPILVATDEPVVETVTAPRMLVPVPFPSPEQAAELLAAALPGADIDFHAVARRFALPPAQLLFAARAAAESALQRGESEPVTERDLAEGCRARMQHDLHSVAARVTATRGWDDLVLPDDARETLAEMIAYAQHGELVYDAWGFAARHGLTRGISALFAGPPGTGKTMCAGVMARALDRDLFRVDLSRVVSKWIGETEKNLGRVFAEAERAHAIVLFDEADSLFAKRTEVKSSVDRYANLEVNFLLQQMEAFSGITILTTNFEDTIDTAFKRRLTFRLRFPKPDLDGRAELWRRAFPESCRLSGDVSPEELARRFEMSGGNIRNAAVRAAFLAAATGRDIDMEICLTAAERECREMGLLVQDRAELRPVEPEEAPPTERRPAPRLVPITHRR